MRHRKHTRCASCAAVGNQRYLEVQWRCDMAGPWNWVGGWMCALCRECWLENTLQLGPQLVAWDG